MIPIYRLGSFRSNSIRDTRRDIRRVLLLVLKMLRSLRSPLIGRLRLNMVTVSLMLQISLNILHINWRTLIKPMSPNTRILLVLWVRRGRILLHR